MAEKFTKATTDDTVVHAARELYRRKFNIGADWTKMRIGAFVSFTNTASLDGTPTTEAIGNATPADRFAFGIAKYSAATLLPGEAGQNFIGMNNHLTETTDLRIGANDEVLFNVAATLFNGGCTIGTVRNTVSANANAAALRLPTAAEMTGTTAWARWWAIEIEILNRGTATQQAAIRMQHTPAATGLVTDTDVRAALSAFTPFATPVTTQNFHIGGVPTEIPDAVLFYVPFLNNRLRVHAYGPLRIA